MDCLEENFPNIKVVEGLVGPDSQKWADLTATQFTANPDIVAIYNHSDTICAVSVRTTLDSIRKMSKPLTLG